MFDLAAAAAMSVSQQVSYRMARAAFDLSVPDPRAGGAIALYQQILADPSMRALPMPDPDSPAAATGRAGAVADRRIEKILATPQGREAYEKFQQAAAEALRQAKTAGDPDQLLNIAKVYPDSRVAADAMLSAADFYESRGDYRMATQVLRQILLRFHDHNRATVLEALARNYLKMPGHIDVAVSRLALAASIEPGTMLHEPLVLPDGEILQNISLASALDILTRYSASVSIDSLPDFHLPTHRQSDAMLKATGRRIGPFQPPTPADTIANVDAMVIPLQGCERNDRIVAWSAAAGLSVYPVGHNKPLFECPAVNQSPLGVAWTGGNLLAWTKDSLMEVDAASGRSHWSIDLATLPAIAAADADAGQQGGEAEQIVQVKPLDDRIIVTTNTGRIFAVDRAAGRVAWQTRLDAAVDTLAANDDFTVVRFQQDQAAQLQVFNTFSGELIGRKSFPLDDGGVFPVNLALAADGTLAYTLPGQLCIQDLFEANASDGGMEPRLVTSPIPDANQMFQNANQPDQLLIHGGRVFAVADSGKEVRVFSVDTAQPWEYHSARGHGDFSGVFPTGSTSPNVTLHISGNYLFMLSPRHLTACRIDPPTEHWETGDDPTRATNYEQLLFGRDYVVMVDHPGEPLTESNRAGSRLTLNMFDRTVKGLPDKESGLLVFTHDLSIQQDTFALQPVEGGIAFFTGHTIRTFLGARDSLEAGAPI